MKKSLKVGVMVGILSAIAAVGTVYMMGASTGLWFDQLTWVSIGLATIVCNVAGGLIHGKWFRKSARPRLNYMWLVAAVTLIMTLSDFINPPAEDFGVVANPVHIVVALLSIWLVPKWTGKEAAEPAKTASRKQAADPFQ